MDRRYFRLMMKEHSDRFSYFRKGYPFLDRMSLVAFTDLGVEYSRNDGHLDPFASIMWNLTLPEWISGVHKDQRDYNVASAIAREMGVIAKKDFSTGIAWGPFTAEYISGGLLLVFLSSLVGATVLVLSINMYGSGLLATPWSLFFLLRVLHLCIEGSWANGMVYTWTRIEWIYLGIFLVVRSVNSNSRNLRSDFPPIEHSNSERLNQHHLTSGRVRLIKRPG